MAGLGRLWHPGEGKPKVDPQEKGLGLRGTPHILLAMLMWALESKEREIMTGAIPRLLTALATF